MANELNGQAVDERYVSEQIILRLGIASAIKPGEKMTIKCPFHADNNPSAVVWFESGTYYCSSCQQRGKLRTLYRDQMGHGINQDLGIKYNPDSPNIRKVMGMVKDPSINLDDTPQTHIALKGRFIPVKDSALAQRYLASRGIPITVATSMKMAYTPDGRTYDTEDPENHKSQVDFSERLCIPIYEKGRLLSCEARDVFGEKYCTNKAEQMGRENYRYAKCLYPKLSSTNTLYQYDKLDKHEKLYAVEGLMDLAVLRSSSHFTEKNSTALFGCAITGRQYHLIKKFDEFCYIVDNDLAGWNSLRSFLNRMKSEKWDNPERFKFLVPPFEDMKVKDVGDIPQKTDKTVEDCVRADWLSGEKTMIDNEALIEERVKYFTELKKNKEKK